MPKATSCGCSSTTSATRRSALCQRRRRPRPMRSADFHGRHGSRPPGDGRSRSSVPGSARSGTYSTSRWRGAPMTTARRPRCAPMRPRRDRRRSTHARQSRSARGPAPRADEASSPPPATRRRLLPAAVHDALVDFADGAHRSRARCCCAGCPSASSRRRRRRRTTPTGKDRSASRRCSPSPAASASRSATSPSTAATSCRTSCPRRRRAHRQTSHLVDGELMFHTEAAFHPHRPRYLLLLCLRGDPAARTTLSLDPRGAAALLGADVVDVLFRAALPHGGRRELPRRPAQRARPADGRPDRRPRSTRRWCSTPT